MGAALRVAWSFPNRPIPEDDDLGGGQPLQPHRTETMDLARADADLRAKPKLAAVVEPRRGVDHHRRGVSPVDEFSRPLVIRRDDALGMLRPVTLDMFDRVIHVAYDSDRENQIEIFRAPVFLGRPLDAGNQGAGFLTTAHLDARAAELRNHARQKLPSDGFMNKTRLHGVAHRRTLNLSVQGDALG